MKRYIKASQETAVVDGERLTAEEIADDIMLEADNNEYVYNHYQELLSKWAEKVVESGWLGTRHDGVSNSAMAYVVDEYRSNHRIRTQNLRFMCYPFLRTYMQDDYDRYKEEFKNEVE